MKSIFTQLRQRQIFKVATIYIVAAWPLIQIVDIAVPVLGLPEAVLPLLFKVFLIGFPISLIFAWLTNFTTSGLVSASAENTSDTGDSSNSKINLRAFATVGGALLAAAIITLGSQLMFGDKTEEELTANFPLRPLPLAAEDSRQSIAVLPFEVFSADVEDEYFVDGMVEELLNLLANIPELNVSARTSSFTYKGVKNKSITQIGSELGVDTILEGSLRKNDVENRVRVTAQLIEVATGAHLFSETFDREYRDIFQIQDEIAHLVTDKMKITLLGADQQVRFVAGTLSVDAMVAYGKGQRELSHRTVTSLSKALAHFEEATELDQNYTRAYVGIADAKVLLTLYGSGDKERALISAQETLDKAFELDPDSGAAHASQGLLLFEQREKAKAEKSFKRAIELNPNYAMAYMWYGSLLQDRGDVVGANQLFTKASALDPKSPVAAFNVAWGNYLLGNEELAMDWFSKIVANDPYYPGTYLLVGHILRGSGRLDESMEMYERALTVDATNKQAISSLLITAMDLGDTPTAQKWFAFLDENPNLLNQNDRLQLEARNHIVNKAPDKAIATLKRLKYGPAEQIYQTMADAEIAYYLGDHALAVTKYEMIRTTELESPEAFFNFSKGRSAAHLAHAYSQSGQHQKAETLLREFRAFLEKTGQENRANAGNYYNRALVHAMLNNTNEAINHLQAAIDSGWFMLWQAEIEPIFSGLAQEPRFKQMMGGVAARLTYMRNRMNRTDEQSLAGSS